MAYRWILADHIAQMSIEEVSLLLNDVKATTNSPVTLTAANNLANMRIVLDRLAPYTKIVYEALINQFSNSEKGYLRVWHECVAACKGWVHNHNIYDLIVMSILYICSIAQALSTPAVLDQGSNKTNNTIPTGLDASAQRGWRTGQQKWGQSTVLVLVSLCHLP